MKNIRIQRSFKLILIAAVLFSLASCADNRADKPNFVFILVDDMGWKDVGCYGSEFYENPNIDRLAKEGMRFTNAYASASVCSPTRASILTGKNPVNHGITEWIPGRQHYHPKEDHRKFMALPFTQQMKIKEYTIAEALQNNGYETFFAGKWHLGGEDYYPPLQGFKHNVGGCSAGGPYGNKEYFYPFGAPVNGKEGDFLTDNLTNQTLAFIKQNKDKPFLAYLSFYTLHNPLMAPDSLVEKYQEKADQSGYISEERFTRNKEWIDALPENNYKVRLVQDNPVYAAMVEIMDRNVGRIMEFLKESNIDDNKVISFTGDNGGLATSEGSNTCNLPLRAGKGWLYEGGIREPTIIKWPQKIQPGSVSDAL